MVILMLGRERRSIGAGSYQSSGTSLKVVQRARKPLEPITGSRVDRKTTRETDTGGRRRSINAGSLAGLSRYPPLLSQ